MQRIDLTPVFILHTRAFRNTSLIVELFSQTHGRIAAVARSARGPTSRYRGQLQCFTPMLVSWSGDHELKTINQIELNGMPMQLNHTALFCAFYLNELLMRVLQKEDPHPDVFFLYHDTLIALQKNEQTERILRLFEKRLLSALGYGLPLINLDAASYYSFLPNQGFTLCERTSSTSVFSGADLLAFAQETLDTPHHLQSAKRLIRQAFQPLLGANPLKSRLLF